MLVVCERWVGDKDGLLYWPPSSSSIIAALISHLGWVAQPWVTEGRKAFSLQAGSHAVILSATDSNHPAPGYIIFLRPPVLPLIYTGASLDWRFGRGLKSL